MSLLYVVIWYVIICWWYVSDSSRCKNHQFMAAFDAPPAGAATLVWFFTASAAALISSRLPQEKRKIQQLLAPTPGDCDFQMFEAFQGQGRFIQNKRVLHGFVFCQGAQILAKGQGCYGLTTWEWLQILRVAGLAGFGPNKAAIQNANPWNF